MDGVGSRLECRNDVLRGRLQQGHDVGDNLVLALDGAQSVELVGTYIEAFLGIRCLQCGGRDTLWILGDNLPEHLGRAVGDLREDDSSRALESAIEGCEVNLAGLESLVQKGVLHEHHLHLALEALTTQGAGAGGIQTGNVHEIEVGVLLQRLAQLLDNESFIFLSHDSYVLKY